MKGPPHGVGQAMEVLLFECAVVLALDPGGMLGEKQVGRTWLPTARRTERPRRDARRDKPSGDCCYLILWPPAKRSAKRGVKSTHCSR